jgi:hypothetical protein
VAGASPWLLQARAVPSEKTLATTYNGQQFNTIMADAAFVLSSRAIVNKVLRVRQAERWRARPTYDHRPVDTSSQHITDLTQLTTRTASTSVSSAVTLSSSTKPSLSVLQFATRCSALNMSHI